MNMHNVTFGAQSVTSQRDVAACNKTGTYLSQPWSYVYGSKSHLVWYQYTYIKGQEHLVT